jgi:hypothetical protein
MLVQVCLYYPMVIFPLEKRRFARCCSLLLLLSCLFCLLGCLLVLHRLLLLEC